MRNWRLQDTMMIAAAFLLAACTRSDAVGPAPPKIEADLSGIYRGYLDVIANDTVCALCIGAPGVSGCSCVYPQLTHVRCPLEATIAGAGNVVDAHIQDRTSTEPYRKWPASVPIYEARVVIDRVGCLPYRPPHELPLDSIITLGTATTIRLEARDIVLYEGSAKTPGALSTVIRGFLAVDFAALTGCVWPSNDLHGHFTVNEARHYPNALDHAEADLVLEIESGIPSRCCVRVVRSSLNWHLERIP
jgi:hypothetical protein